MAKKIDELNLIMFGTVYLEPCEVAFNDDFYDTKDTGTIIFSDSNSIIYELQLKLTESKEMYQYKFGKIFDFKKEIVKGNVEYDDIEFDFYNMEKNDRILDMKIIVSGDNLTGERHSGIEGKDIAILAITKHVLFQFYGKNSFKDAFYKYSVENGKILKAYKKFISSDKLEDKYLRIQLINENRQELEKKRKFIWIYDSMWLYYRTIE